MRAMKTTALAVLALELRLRRVRRQALGQRIFYLISANSALPTGRLPRGIQARRRNTGDGASGGTDGYDPQRRRELQKAMRPSERHPISVPMFPCSSAD